ncbi:MAG: hypothetical protein ACRENE_28160, partial [Polyangiaceae bacterium]
MYAPAVLVADYARSVDVAGTAGLVGRGTVQSTPGAPTTAAYGLDLLLRPGAHLSLRSRRVELDVRDSLAFTAPDLENDVGCSGCSETVQLFDYFDVSLAWRSRRRARFGVAESASGGLYNSSNLLQPPPPLVMMPGTLQAPTAPAAVQLVPAPSTITTGSTRTMANAAYEMTRLSAVGVSGSYLVAGGLDGASQAYLPLQQTARADAYFEQTVARRDHVTTLGYVQDTRFSPGPCLAIAGATATTAATVAQCAPHDELVQLGESWRHELDRAGTLTVMAAATGVHITGVGAQTSFWCNGGDDCLYPSAGVSLSSRLGFRGTTVLLLDASVAPLVDVRSGLVSERLQLVASVANPLSRHVELRIDGSGSQSVPPSDPLAASLVMG